MPMRTATAYAPPQRGNGISNGITRAYLRDVKVHLHQPSRAPARRIRPRSVLAMACEFKSIAGMKSPDIPSNVPDLRPAEATTEAASPGTSVDAIVQMTAAERVNLLLFANGWPGLQASWISCIGRTKAIGEQHVTGPTPACRCERWPSGDYGRDRSALL